MVIPGAQKTQEVNDPRKVKTAKPEDNISESKKDDNATMLRAMNDTQAMRAAAQGKSVRFSPAKSRKSERSVLDSAKKSLQSISATSKQTASAAMANTIPPGTASKPDQNTSAKSYFKQTKKAGVAVGKPQQSKTTSYLKKKIDSRVSVNKPGAVKAPERADTIHQVMAKYRSSGAWPGAKTAKIAAHRNYMDRLHTSYTDSQRTAAHNEYNDHLQRISHTENALKDAGKSGARVRSAPKQRDNTPPPRPQPDGPAPTAAKKKGLFSRVKSIFGMKEQVEILKKTALDEAIRNLGRGSAGSAVRGGRQRKGRKRVSPATMTRKANADVVQALKSDTKAKATASKVSQARREGEYNKAVERQKMQQYHV